MAHHTTQRRILAPSDPKISMDPTHKKHHPKSTPTPTPTPATTHPNPTQNFSSSLYSNHKDTHVLAKAMSLSTTADSSNTLLLKSTHHFLRTTPDVKHQNKAAAATTASKEKLKKWASKDKDEKKSHSGQDIIIKQPYETDINRFSSGAIVKIKEMNKSFQDLDVKRPSVLLGRRRSICGSQVKLADFFTSNSAKVVSVDMPPFMQIHAVDCARKAYDSLEKFTSKALASTLKKEFDGVYGPAWHCIVGTGFGSFVTHSVGGFLYFSMDQKLYVLLFKTTVQRAD